MCRASRSYLIQSFGISYGPSRTIVVCSKSTLILLKTCVFGICFKNTLTTQFINMLLFNKTHPQSFLGTTQGGTNCCCFVWRSNSPEPHLPVTILLLWLVDLLWISLDQMFTRITRHSYWRLPSSKPWGNWKYFFRHCHVRFGWLLVEAAGIGKNTKSQFTRLPWVSVFEVMLLAVEVPRMQSFFGIKLYLYIYIYALYSLEN